MFSSTLIQICLLKVGYREYSASFGLEPSQGEYPPLPQRCIIDNVVVPVPDVHFDVRIPHGKRE